MEKHTNLSKLQLESLSNNALEHIKGGVSTNNNTLGIRNQQDDKRRERPGGIQTQVKGKSFFSRSND
jgi:hypothetical protein